ncbi:ABC transporter substrate-binding protein [Prauserella cavernicola]|uniref:ABC transporter substrate-binding protein n=1 Tax=Prauserella cavernicola TaxID=2800127 RepID=A0A934QVE7_9PSEU|nr:ABC transporter substrate-binding protein [Prauserella cavernicola]MBK1787245.1 ABC transporter substrate-binding protein [Prauserella cavernicola]
MSSLPKSRLLSAAVALVSIAAVVTGCSRAEDTSEGAAPAQSEGPASEVRLGYFPNVTHAPAIIGVNNGLFADELGSTTLTTQTFNSGTEEVNALLGGSLDIGFIGSGPAINAFTKSEGTIQIASGAVSGGAQLVVKPDITSKDQLRGKTIATPSLGNTQDVALKKWLDENDLTDSVEVANLDNPQTFDAFRGGEVDGGWLPEPWSSRLVDEAGARVLLDEKELWPDGKFPTTVIVVRSEFLQQHPETVRGIVAGSLAASDWASSNPDEARTTVNDGIKELTGSELSPAVLDRAFSNITLSSDPNSATYTQLAKDSVTAGIVDTPADLQGFLDLRLLNEVLKEQGRPAIDAADLQAN